MSPQFHHPLHGNCSPCTIYLIAYWANQEKYLEQGCANYKAGSKCRKVLMPDKLRGASLSTQGCQRSIYSNNICQLEAPLKIIRPTEAGIWFLGSLKCRWGCFSENSCCVLVLTCFFVFFLRDNDWNLRHFKAPSKQNLVSRMPRHWLRLIQAHTGTGTVPFRCRFPQHCIPSPTEGNACILLCERLLNLRTSDWRPLCWNLVQGTSQ